MKLLDILSPKTLIKKLGTTMHRKFIAFSIFLFLLIFVAGSAAFFILMNRTHNANLKQELSKAIELESLKLENLVNGEIALVLKKAQSPLLRVHFENPDNTEYTALIFEEMMNKNAFAAETLFWINNTDKRFYANNIYIYTVDINDSDSYWYKNTLYHTEHYNFNINYNPHLDSTNLWINAPVFDRMRNPLGVFGAGMDIKAFLESVYRDYKGSADLYFFNSDGEITGAKKSDMVTEKRNIKTELDKIGEEIFLQAKQLNEREKTFFKIKNWRGMAAVGRIPALDWYIAVVQPTGIFSALRNQLTYLFFAMMLLIAVIFVIFNMFVMGLMGPFNSIINNMNQLSIDWDLRKNKDEAETLGEFYKMAIYDPLTGVCNRRYMEGGLKKLIKSMSRNNDKLSVLMVDIDFFKKYNDTYGHAKGDDCLKIIADVLGKIVTRSDDFVARFGGEEFVVALPGTDEAGARTVAIKMIEKIRELNIPHETSEAAPCVTVSIGGTSSSVVHTQTCLDYIRSADEALYLSKNNGRNMYSHTELKTLLTQ